MSDSTQNASGQGASGFWKHGLLLTLLFGFTIMLVGGAYIYKTKAPIPATVVDASGAVLFTAEDVQSGQELFRKRNLMNYGSVLGHGAYFGPDYTAEAIHWMTDAMRARPKCCSMGLPHRRREGRDRRRDRHRTEGESLQPGHRQADVHGRPGKRLGGDRRSI
jgi:nitric oxide reductase subunit B